MASVHLTNTYGAEFHAQKVGEFWVDQSVRTVKRVDTKYIEQLFEELATIGNWNKEDREAVWNNLFTSEGERIKSLRLGKEYASDELTTANKKLGAILKDGIEAGIENGTLNDLLLSASVLLVQETIAKELTTPNQELFKDVTENLDALKTNDAERLCRLYDAMRTFNAGLETEMERLRDQLLQSEQPEGYKITESAPRRKFNLEGFRSMVQDPEAEPPVKESSFKICYIMDERLYNIKQQYSRRAADQTEQNGQTDAELNELFL